MSAITVKKYPKPTVFLISDFPDEPNLIVDYQYRACSKEAVEALLKACQSHLTYCKDEEAVKRYNEQNPIHE